MSLVAPAAASLTFVTNAVAARFFLREDVDRRRWMAAILVFAGVALLARQLQENRPELQAMRNVRAT